jgi:pyruvate/2-oxoglutarate/acetoin dehydrogenase E1 component
MGVTEESVDEIRYVQAVRQALAELLDGDDRTFLMGEEIGLYGGVFRATEGLQERFGANRVRDTPICEQSLVGTAIGASIVGRRPIVEIMFMDFIACAMDAIANHATKLRAMSGGQIQVPLIIRTQGGTGTKHGPQHSQLLESWFTHIPGLAVVMPSTPADVLGLYRTAGLLDDPVVVIEHRLLYRTVGEPGDGRAIPFGEAAVRRRGTDLTIVATALMNHRALEAAARLAEEGIEVEVIDPRTLVPLDLDTIVASIRGTRRLLVVHEEIERSGWGGELIASVMHDCFDVLAAAPARLATANVPIPFGPDLERLVVPQVEDVISAARRLCGADR